MPLVVSTRLLFLEITKEELKEYKAGEVGKLLVYSIETWI
jgi:hypothetical protein